jgi:hypothetical protein
MTAKKKQSLNDLEWWLKTSTREVLAFQWKKITSDIRIPFLWIVEIVLAVILATSIAIYLDPEVNVLAEPWNYAAFVIIATTAIWLHAFTRPFRVMRRISKKDFRKK